MCQRPWSFSYRGRIESRWLVVVGSEERACHARRAVRGGTRNVETVIERVAASPRLEAATGEAGGDPVPFGQFLRRQRRPKIPLVLSKQP